MANTPEGLILDVGGVGYLVARDAGRGPQGRVRGRGHGRDVLARPGGRAPALRLRRSRRARAVRPAPRGQRGRAEGRARDRLRLAGRRAAARDRARGLGALRGDPRHRQEDGPAHRARAEGEARRRGSDRSGSRPGRPYLVARDALVELGWSLLDAERALAEVDSDAAAGGAGPARVEESRMNATQFLTPALERRRGGGRADAAAAPARRIRRPGAHQGAARDRARRGEGPRRGARPRPARRAARARQDEPRAHHPRGARRRHPIGRRARARAQGDIAAILTALEPRDVLFVDEIHRLSRAVEEILYPALEDFRLDIVDRPGAGRAHAHARPAAVHAGRRDDPHGPPDDAAARSLRDDVPARLLRGRRARDDRPPLGRGSSASRSPTRRPTRSRGRARGTPRVAQPDPAPRPRRRRGAARGRDHDRDRREALELLEVDEAGLERFDRELLAAIVEKFGGGPVGLNTLAVGARRGARHDRGRLRAVSAAARLPPAHAARPHVTELGRAHLGAAPEPEADARLF